MTQFGQELRAMTEPGRFTLMVRAILSQAEPINHARADWVAGHCGISARGLRTCLAREGTSFRTLLQAELLCRSEALLRYTDWSIQGIAMALGYAQSSNFVRVFQMRFVDTPGHYRSRERKRR